VTYRERFQATLAHRKVDRVPFDLGGTSLTGIEQPETMQKLRLLLCFEGCYAGWYQKFDERILSYLDIDFRRVGQILEPKSSLSSFNKENEYTDCWGIKRVFTGLYWEIKDPPLRKASEEDLDRYPWPEAGRVDTGQIDRFREEARKLYNETEYVVCAEHPVYGIFELGCWMCGFDEFLLRMALDPGFVKKFCDKILDYQKEIIEIYYRALGGYIHLTTSGDDFGAQNGPFISPAMFQDLVKPYYRERISHTKRFSKAYYFHHTCGSVYSLIPDLIEAGVDILNPIQPGARDMEPERLKKDFGDKLTFWGGIDTQHMLRCSTPAEIREETFRVLKAMSEDGGYVLAPAHNLQQDIPPENIVALFTAGRDFF